MLGQYLVGFLCILQVFSTKNAPIRAGIETLEYVHVIWRHGDRTPGELIFEEDAKKWPQGIGELTKEGVAQQYRLGQWLRKRYGDWIDDQHLSSQVYIRSSDYNRTLMSALANMAGMFPPKTGLDTNLMWQPVPVHTMPKYLDKELYEDIPCPNAAIELSNQWKSDKADMIRKEYKYELELFAEKTNIGRKTMELKEVWKVYDNYFCEKSNNIEWPTWMNSTIFDRLTDLYNQLSTLEFHTEKLRRLRGGTLLEEIFNRFTAKVNGSLGPDAKFYAYSAHDATIAALLSTFGIFYEIFPKYATCLMIEMHKFPQNSSHILRVYHKNETDREELIEYTIPGCEYPCTLEKLNVDLNRYFPSDWSSECGLTLFSSFHNCFSSQYCMYFIFPSIIFITFSSIILLVLLLFCRKYSKSPRFPIRKNDEKRDDSTPMLNLELDDSDLDV